MKWIKSFGTIFLSCVLLSFFVSVLLGMVNGILSFFGVVDDASVSRYVLFFSIPFVVSFSFSLVEFFVTIYHYKKDPVFKGAIDCDIVELWIHWKRLTKDHPEWLDNKEEDPKHKEERHYYELVNASFEAMNLKPQKDIEEWMDFMMKNYECEIIDAFGTDVADQYSGLRKVWKEGYFDISSGRRRTIEEWGSILLERRRREMLDYWLRKNG